MWPFDKSTKELQPEIQNLLTDKQYERLAHEAMHTGAWNVPCTLLPLSSKMKIVIILKESISDSDEDTFLNDTGLPKDHVVCSHNYVAHTIESLEFYVKEYRDLAFVYLLLSKREKYEHIIFQTSQNSKFTLFCASGKEPELWDVNRHHASDRRYYSGEYHDYYMPYLFSRCPQACYQMIASVAMDFAYRDVFSAEIEAYDRSISDMNEWAQYMVEQGPHHR